jgi:hypothetical protein
MGDMIVRCATALLLLDHSAKPWDQSQIVATSPPSNDRCNGQRQKRMVARIGRDHSSSTDDIESTNEIERIAREVVGDAHGARPALAAS